MRINTLKGTSEKEGTSEYIEKNKDGERGREGGRIELKQVW
jgi:hypothetical protein